MIFEVLGLGLRFLFCSAESFYQMCVAAYPTSGHQELGIKSGKVHARYALNTSSAHCA